MTAPTFFDNRYEIIRELGRGGMGIVWLARNIRLHTFWAIKQVNKRPDSKVNLLAETEISKRLKHPALPRIFDIWEDEQSIYIVVDYIEGVPLNAQLKESGRFSEGVVAEWARQLCEVLLYLHRQKPNPIIYRDMKPSNIIIDPEGNVKLIDFGIAREYRADSEGDTSYIGTRGYAAPEQYGTAQTDERSDIYSLGVTLYHLLTGKSPNEPPYEFLPLRTVDSQLSEGIDYVVARCVQNDPKNRYQHVGEVLKDLHNIHIFNSAFRRFRRVNAVKTVVKLLMVVGFSFLIFAGVGQSNIEKIERFEQTIRSGFDLLDRYRFDEAYAVFSEANNIMPDHKSGYLGIGQIFLKKGDYDECISYLSSILGQLPNLRAHGQFNYVMGTAYYNKKEYRQAADYFELSVQTEPKETLYLRDLAVSYAKTGELSKAKDLLDSIVAHGVEDAVAEYLKGQVMLAEKNITDAIDSFTRVTDTANEDLIKKKAFLELANIYKENRNTMAGALEKQIVVLEKAESVLPDKDDIIITELLAESYFAAQRLEESAAKFRRLLEIGYDRPYIYRNLGIIYQQMGSYVAAEEILFIMIDRYPEDYRCYLQLAFLFLETEGKKPENSRDYQKILDNYELAVKFSPGGANNVDLKPLENKIAELRQLGWL